MKEPQQDRAMDLLKRYVHASGSLHELAEAYGMSAGTHGLRVDRLIDRMQTQPPRVGESPFEQTLRIKYLYGKIGRSILKELMHAYREFLRGTV